MMNSSKSDAGKSRGQPDDLGWQSVQREFAPGQERDREMIRYFTMRVSKRSFIRLRGWGSTLFGQGR